MSSQPDLPTVTRKYQNHHLDSTRWDLFKPRADDIVVATTQKSGTTWTQQIVSLLIFQDEEPPGPFHDISIYVDIRLSPADEMAKALEAQTHRRFLKTHLALDGFPFDPNVKHIFVSRDGRDIAMSLWNMVTHYSTDFRAAVDNMPGRVGDPFPPAPEKVEDFLENWINRGWFDWEGDGYPYWSQLHTVKTWWEYRHLPNIMFVHYNDLLKDLKGEIKRIADYLDIKVTDEYLKQITELSTFASMKERAEEVVPTLGNFFDGGAQTFIFKGTNGRWKDVMNDKLLADYDRRVNEVLTPEAAHWLEHGGSVK